ncbi:uncharacterized protein B0H18DRAFT_993427, partial [Fomitopsis serialis]|uniref:uncharacterized protein n=1 Tax=Fomitopsis serialis TaxID=139415 RepID=UPI00200791AB
MKWPPGNGKMRFVLKTSTGLSVGVTFTGKCARHIKVLACNFREELKLSTKGAVVTETEENVALSLLYEQGASLMFTKTRNNIRDGEVVDTWRLDEDAEQSSPGLVNTDDWYGTPSRPQRPVSKTVHTIDTTDVDVPASGGATNRDSVAPSHDIMPLRLAASTSGFSPSVQLAATRRSTSILTQVRPDTEANPDGPIRDPDGKPNKPTSPSPAVVVSEVPADDAFNNESHQARATQASLIRNTPLLEEVAPKVIEQGPPQVPSRPAENQSRQDNNGPRSKKSEKARLRKQRKLL